MSHVKDPSVTCENRATDDFVSSDDRLKISKTCLLSCLLWCRSPPQCRFDQRYLTSLMVG